MVGVLFFLMVAIELSMEWAINKASEICCKKKGDGDVEDPAALVGSFKRYKN